MKFNYKKVASVLASAVMITSTIGFAAAGNYPTPFTDGAAVIYGTNAASSDMAAAINIYDQLKTRTTASTGSDATVAGEAKAVETASQKLYMGDVMNATKKTFTKDDLPTVLASGTLTGSDGKEYKYEQRLEIPNAAIKYGDTSDNLATPVLYADFESSSYYYELRVVFPTAVTPSNLTDNAISLFGKNYVFSGTNSDLTTTQLVFYEKATPVIVNDGESVTAEGHTITVAVEDADTASVTIDGTTASKNEGWSGKIGGVDVYVKNVVGPNVAGTSRYVELYLNSNKLVLENGEDVTLGSDTVDGTTATITTSGSTKISEFKIKVAPYSLDDSVKYVKKGGSFTDPVFKTLKFEFASATPDLEETSRDYMLIRPSGEKKVLLEFTNEAGKKYSLDILRDSTVALNSSRGVMYNATCQAWNGSVCTTGTVTYYATQLGVGADYDLVTTSSANAGENDYFMTCSGDYSQIWNVKTINPGDTKVKVQDAGSDSTSTEISLSSANNGATASLTLADGSSTTIVLVSNTSGSETINVSAACDNLYTKKGARIFLGAANAPAGNSSLITIQQETAYNGGDFSSNDGSTTLGSKNVTVRFDYTPSSSGKDMKIRDVLGTSDDGSDLTDYWYSDVGDYDKYYVTKYGTFVKQTGDTDKQVEVWYPENAMALGFYVGEEAAAITPGSTGTAGGQISIVKDTEVDTVKAKNLIVVGGSCVNAVAAKILGSDTPMCGDAFTTATTVGAGGYIIQVIESPYNTDKVAMLVAGYNADDTTNAVKRAMVIDGVNTAVGTKEIFPVTS